MLIGIGAALLGAVCHLFGAVRGAHTAGWILSIVGALALGGTLWNTHPGVGIAVAVGVLVLVDGVPGLISGFRPGRATYP
ncbi:hypothetical protein [Prescottella subtropica]|uniref:hypothetical protein n=1 Tax=Prescottella subtropica TaxID=2545757 RepID=UPI0010F71BEE|nr:hypothetical protein [Prescottella subtropica]